MHILSKNFQSGCLLVEASSAKQSTLPSNCSAIEYFSAQVHKTLNTARGLIPKPDIFFSTKDERVQNLKTQDIIDACRITFVGMEQ